MKKLLLLVAITFSLAFTASAQYTVRVGAPAPQFSAISMDGNQYDLSQLNGQVVVVTFWSTRCAICQSELPKMNQLVKSYQGKDVVFLAVTNENDDRIEPYLRKNPQVAHVIPNGFGIMLSYADRDKEGNLDFGYPSYFVIDKAGKLAYRGSGWDKTQTVGSAVDSVLGQ